MDDIWNAKTTKVKVYKMINTLEGGTVLMGDYHFQVAGLCFRNF